MFRVLNYRIGFSGGGGGGSSRNFSPKQINHIPSISGHFWYIFGPPADHPPFMDTRGNSGTLPMSACTFKPRNNINSFRKKNVYQKFGGAMAPLAPPPGYATAQEREVTMMLRHNLRTDAHICGKSASQASLFVCHGRGVNRVYTRANKIYPI